MTGAVASWPEVLLHDICRPRQWPTISQAALVDEGYPVYGANGRIGYYSEFNHAKATVLITCRGATCGTINVCEPRSYVTGNSMALDDLDEARVLREYLVYALRRRSLAKAISGTAQPQITRESLTAVSIPLPSLTEQRRIAETLDRAEALRAKRRAALAQLDELIQSSFLDMFGDPTTNPKRWPLRRLSEMLALPLRNGVSPSLSGTSVARVLTLSAITGGTFDPDASKVSVFQVPPPPHQAVCRDDFLICRGNGNVSLVGRGRFPSRSMPDVTFPDTMIAARTLVGVIDRNFLEHVWNSSAVRRQLESLARTTNGTYKVNQTILEGITIIVPPLPLQHDFSRCVAAVEKLRSSQSASLTSLDELFASLQHRAFRGEL